MCPSGSYCLGHVSEGSVGELRFHGQARLNTDLLHWSSATEAERSAILLFYRRPMRLWRNNHGIVVHRGTNTRAMSHQSTGPSIR